MLLCCVHQRVVAAKKGRGAVCFAGHVQQVLVDMFQSHSGKKPKGHQCLGAYVDMWVLVYILKQLLLLQAAGAVAVPPRADLVVSCGLVSGLTTAEASRVEELGTIPVGATA